MDGRPRIIRGRHHPWYLSTGQFVVADDAAVAERSAVQTSWSVFKRDEVLGRLYREID